MSQPRRSIAVLSLVMVGVVYAVGRANGADTNSRYILLNLAASEIHDEGFQRIKQVAEIWKPGHPRLGVGAIISYLRDPPAETPSARRILTARKFTIIEAEFYWCEAFG